LSARTKPERLRSSKHFIALVAEEGNFDVTLDYPRMRVEDYRHEVEVGERSVATPIQATFALDSEIEEIKKLFGSSVGSDFTLSKSYDNKLSFGLTADSPKALAHMIKEAALPDQARDALTSAKQDVDGLTAALGAQEQTEEVKRLSGILATIKKRNLNGYIYDTFIAPRLPKFLYFDEYYQMTGHENIEALIQRQNTKALKSSDHPLLGLIKLARLELPELLNPNSTIELKGKLQGASNT
jgi:hypothetical protein